MPNTLTLTYHNGFGTSARYHCGPHGEVLKVNLNNMCFLTSLRYTVPYIEQNPKIEIVDFSSQTAPQEMHAYEWCAPIIPFATKMEEINRPLTINLSGYWGISGAFMEGLFVISYAFPKLKFSFSNPDPTENINNIQHRTWNYWQLKGITLFTEKYIWEVAKTLIQGYSKELQDTITSRIKAALQPQTKTPGQLTTINIIPPLARFGLLNYSEKETTERSSSAMSLCSDAPTTTSSREYSK